MFDLTLFLCVSVCVSISVSFRFAVKVLTAQWFITLFAYALGLKDTLRVWDYVFLGGWEAVFRVAVALLCCVEEEVGAVDEHEY